jgi:hypothetical protein
VAAWVDLDNDGLIDLLTVPDGAFRRSADGRFISTGGMKVEPGDSVVNARLAVGDWDGDGDRDAVVALQRQRPEWRLQFDEHFRADVPAWRLLDREWQVIIAENELGAGHWLELDLVGSAGNRNAIGARVELESDDALRIAVVGQSDSANYSQGHYRLYFGLGRSRAPASALVHWRKGEVERFDLEGVDRRVVLTAGAGTPVAKPSDRGGQSQPPPSAR